MSSLRQLTQAERQIVDRLLEAKFPGRDEIYAQLRQPLVKTIDDDGSLEFHVENPIKAPVQKRIPIEGEVDDEDGVMIHVLLHVVDGIVTELEIYKDDGSPIVKRPRADEVRVLALY